MITVGTRHIAAYTIQSSQVKWGWYMTVTFIIWEYAEKTTDTRTRSLRRHIAYWQDLGKNRWPLRKTLRQCITKYEFLNVNEACCASYGWKATLLTINLMIITSLDLHLHQVVAIKDPKLQEFLLKLVQDAFSAINLYKQ